MKKLICVFLSIVFCVASFCPAVVSAQDGEITDERFPDPGFRQWLAGSGFDQDGDGRFSQEELDAVTELDFSGYTGPAIYSLEGIQLFCNLERLDFGYGSAIAFTELDLSGNPALVYLDCSGTSLTTLDVSGNPALETLSCSYTDLTTLDLSGNPALEWLYCSNTNLTTLDLSGNPALYWLECDYTDLTTLDLSGNPALYSLSCSNTNLTTLNVSGNPALTDLYCPDTNLTTLDLSGNPALTDLNCSDTDLTTLDLSGNPALEILYCPFTDLTTLDLSGNPALYWLGCYETNLTTLDVSGNPALTDLNCSDTNLTTLNVSDNPALKELYCYETNLAELDLSGNPALEDLACSNTDLTTLDLSGNPALETLNCYNTNITTLDLSDNPALVYLDCSETNLTTLDLSGNPALETLDCSDAGLTTLDLSGNPALKALYCYNANITSLNLSNNPALETLSCSHTNLTMLDLSGNPALYWLGCHDTNLTTLDLSHNPALETLYCSNTNITTLDVSHNPNLSSIDVSDTNLIALNLGERDYTSENGKNVYFTSVEIAVPVDSYDLRSYDPLFDSSKISNLMGATLNGSVLSGYRDGELITYDYTCGSFVWNGETLPILLKVTLSFKIEEAPVPASVTFYTEDGSAELGKAFVRNGQLVDADGNPTEPPTAPEKPATQQYSYTFNTWVDEEGKPVDLLAVTDDTKVYASYTATFKNPFADADMSRYYGAAVEYVTAHGIMNGTDATHFSPNGTATRGMIVTVLYRMEGSPSVEGMENKFTDVPEGKYYTDAVKWASNVGVVNGTGDNTFSPDNNVTREQFATMIYRYAGEIKGYYMSCGNANLNIFADKNDISTYAVGAVRWAIASEKDMTGDGITYYNKTALIEGIKVDENTVNMNPKGNATRGQMATMLYRFISGEHLDAADIE